MRKLNSNKDVYKKLHRITKLYLQTLGDEIEQILNDADDFEKTRECYDVIIKTLDTMYGDEDCVQLGKLTDGRMSILRAFLEGEGITNIHNSMTDVVKAHDDVDGAWGAVALVSLFNIVDTVYQFMNTYLTMFQTRKLITNEEEQKLRQMIVSYNKKVESKIPVLSFEEIKVVDPEIANEKGE